MEPVSWKGDTEYLVHVLSRLNRTYKMQKSEILLMNSTLIKYLLHVFTPYLNSCLWRLFEKILSKWDYCGNRVTEARGKYLQGSDTYITIL